MWVWSTQTHYSQDRGRMLVTVANALALCLAKRSHMVTMEICSYHAVTSGRCSSLTSFRCYNSNDKRFFSPVRTLCYSMIVGNFTKLNVANVKCYFPFNSRQKISPQNPIMLATGSHLFKGKNSVQKLPGQWMQLLHPCIKPADCGYQIGAVMQS